MLASALLLVVGAAGAAPAIAAEDEYLIRLHSPCHTALAEERKAARRLKVNPSREDAQNALNFVRAGLDWNENACRKIASPSREQKNVREKMYLVNKGFLYSLQGEAEYVLGENPANSFKLATRPLQQCTQWSELRREVQKDCETQLRDNELAVRPGVPNPDCQAALVAANDAGDALKPKDYASLQKAYQRATEGLVTNSKCPPGEKMHDVNNAYLLTWKTVAERYLDVPFANPADPFGIPNALFAKCAGRASPLPAPAKVNCEKQLNTNRQFVQDLAVPPPLNAGLTARPLPWTPIDWPDAYALRSDFVWDGGCKNVENARCADEVVRDGNGPNGWGPAPKGQATPLDDQQERVLFATIRHCDDLHRLFSGQPPQISCDFLKSNILLVIAQRKPHQQCYDMSIKSVESLSSPPAALKVRDGVRVEYSLKCQPPGSASSGGVITRVLSIPSKNENGDFATVTFVELGGAGPVGATH